VHLRFPWATIGKPFDLGAVYQPVALNIEFATARDCGPEACDTFGIAECGASNLIIGIDYR